jgi:hypothetical protein
MFSRLPADQPKSSAFTRVELEPGGRAAAKGGGQHGGRAHGPAFLAAGVVRAGGGDRPTEVLDAQVEAEEGQAVETLGLGVALALGLGVQPSLVITVMPIDRQLVLLSAAAGSLVHESLGQLAQARPCRNLPDLLP